MKRGFPGAVSGNAGWAGHDSLAPLWAVGNTLGINKYAQCQLYPLMTLIARQTGADAWWCLEFEICFIDCQSDVFGGRINNPYYCVASDVEPKCGNHKITPICCLTVGHHEYWSSVVCIFRTVAMSQRQIEPLNADWNKDLLYSTTNSESGLGADLKVKKKRKRQW